MLTPGLAVEEVLKKVRVEVMAETEDRQVPWEASSLTGSFRFLDAPAQPPRDDELDKLRREMEQMRAVLSAQEERAKAEQARREQARDEQARADATDELRRQNENLRQQVEEIKQLQLAALEKQQGRDPEKEALRDELGSLKAMREEAARAEQDRQAMAEELQRLKAMLASPASGPAPPGGGGDKPMEAAPRHQAAWTMAVAPYGLQTKSCTGCTTHIEGILRKIQARNMAVLYPVYSAVPPEMPEDTKPLPRPFDKNDFRERLWSMGSPVPEAMAAMGKALGVDAVLAMRLEYDHPSPYKYRAWLLDIHSGVMLSRQMQRPSNMGTSSTWSRKFLGLTDDMVAEFEANRRAEASAAGKQ